MLRFLPVFFCLWGTNTALFGQESLSVALIPDSLLTDANTIVRYSHEHLNVTKKSRATYQIEKAVTVLNTSGLEDSSLKIHYGNNVYIENLEVRIYDRNGDFVRRLTDDEFYFRSVGASGTGVTDDYVKFIEPKYNELPYSYTLSYRKVYKGYINLPGWNPISQLNESVENSDFSLTYHASLGVRTKGFLVETPQADTSTKGLVFLKWQMSGFMAMDELERFAPPVSEHIPHVMVAPSAFAYEGEEGNQATWNDFGKWLWELNLERDELPEMEENYLDKQLKERATSLEKASFLYSYMQSKTRYVSVQLGIGGFQPAPATEVCEKGYGDCKGLSNYMLSMLSYAGVEAYYCLVQAGKTASPIVTDFPSNQFNHIILCLPNEGDTIWLECTSQNQPFGYLGTFTSNRFALLISEQGGKLVQTKRYPFNQNTKVSIAEIDLRRGEALANIVSTYKGIQFENVSGQLEASDKERAKWLLKELSIPSFRVEKATYTLQNRPIPVVTESLNLKLNSYVSKTSTRLLIPLSLINRLDFDVDTELSNRVNDFYMLFGFVDADTLTYLLPEGYQVESIPDEVNFKSPVGSYHASASFEGDKLVYYRKLTVREGRWSNEQFGAIADFVLRIKRADQKRAVFKRVQ